MRKHAVWIAVGAIVIVAAVSALGMKKWRSSKHVARRLSYAEELLTANRPAEALELLVAADAPTSPNEIRRLGELKVEAFRKTGLTGKLRELYYTSPEWFSGNEEASLLVAREMLSTDDAQRCEEICSEWRERRTLDSAWFVLQVDQLLVEGKREEAIRRLKQTEFQGKDDFPRLSRLALTANDPSQAWEYLEQAFAKDSTNPTLRLFRGNMLEAAGRRAEARLEYIAAFVADPSDALMCDQLAEFYRRVGNHRAAQQSWAELNSSQTTDFVELKRNFWSQVAAPMTGEPRISPPGPWKEFSDYLADLGEGRFWDEAKFQQLASSASLLKLRQEPFWLQLMQLLKDCDETPLTLEEIRDVLVESHIGGSFSYSDDLQRGLTLAVTYKLQSNLDAPGVARVEPTGEASRRHRFFDRLDQAHYEFTQNLDSFTLPRPLHVLLKDPNCFAVIAMAAGWTEAAVRLDAGEPIDADAPDWATYGMTQAFRLNRGVPAALQYASRQHPSELLSLLVGELHLSQHDITAAEHALQPLALQNTEIGVRAAWLLAMSRLNEGALDAAESAVQANQRFRSGKLGREMLAKIALLRDDADEAKSIYGQIDSDSFEGGVFAAREAFAQQDWTQAENLTRRLLTQMPDSLQLRDNLRKIENARGEHAR